MLKRVGGIIADKSSRIIGLCIFNDIIRTADDTRTENPAARMAPIEKDDSGFLIPPKFSFPHHMSHKKNMPNDTFQMTSKQQIIARYTDGLSNVMAVNYYLYYLSTGSDEISNIMIMDSLTRISKMTGNPRIIKKGNKAMNGIISTKFGTLKDDDKKEKLFSSPSYDKINASFSKLYIKDALEMYNVLKGRKSNYDKIYQIRSLCNIGLLKRGEALELALKSENKFLIFVTALGDCNLEIAKSHIQFIIDSIENKTKNDLMSLYETIISIAVVAFAKLTTVETESIIPKIISKEFQSYDFPLIEEMFKYFKNHNFVAFVKKLPELEKILKDSFLTGRNASRIIENIKANVIVNFFMVYTNFPLKDFEKAIGLPYHEAYNLLLQKIKDFTILGKIDDINQTFIGGNQNQQYYENYSILTRTQIIRETYQNNKFISLYNSSMS